MKIEINEEKLHELYLRDLAIGKLLGPTQNIPNISKPWLKYYEQEAITKEDFEGSAIEYLEEENKKRLYTTAIEYFNIKMDYDTFFKKIETSAKSFLESGIKENDYVTISLPNIPENLIAIYALNKIGAIANLIDLRLKSNKLVKAINKTNSEFIITSDLFCQNLDEVIDETSIKKVVITSPVESLNPIMKTMYKIKTKIHKPKNFSYETWKQFYEKGIFSTKKINHRGKNDDVACVMHTSGTTGDSKGVELTNKNFNAMASQLKYSGFKLKAGDKFLNQVPPFLAFNELIASHFPLSLGLNIRLLPDYQPDIFYKNISKYKPNHTVAGPADWSSFLNDTKAKNKKYDYLVSMVSGSDKLSEENKQRVNKIFEQGGSKEKITEGYGMTEVGSAAVTNLPQINVKDSVGIPLPDVNICIFDNDTNTALGYNQIGEICFSGETVMKGYINNKDATNEVLRLHDDGKYWMHSGDLGYMDEDGLLYLKGRLKRIIIRHDGIKVSPLDIEKILSSNPFVKECCVIGIDDEEHGFGSIPVANIVVNDNNTINEEDIKNQLLEYCKDNLSENYIPKDIVIKKELPLTPVGKVDYRKLISEYNQQKNIKTR